VSSDCVWVRLSFQCIAMSVRVTRVNCPIIRKNIAKRVKYSNERCNVVAGVSSMSMLWLKRRYWLIKHPKLGFLPKRAVF
jgi:hypothetical protein